MRPGMLMNSPTGYDDAHLLRVETVRRDDAAWVVLQGEADLATLQELEVALSRIPLDDAKVVHLHLDHLTFADVATLRQLTAFARTAKQSGRDIQTCGANSMIRKVARLLAVHEDLGLYDA